MTHSRNREHDRAVRRYQRDNPGTTLAQARAAVGARSARQTRLPDRIPSAPLPRPAERLEGYVQRVAAAAGIQRHRAMELLGLTPGTSATGRLDRLASGPLPEHTVHALVAATGMTPAQARALTAPLPTRPDLEAVRRTTEAAFPAGYFRRGGAGKTKPSVDLAAAVSLALAQQSGMTGLDSPGAPDEPPTGADEFARLLADMYGPRVLPVDLPVDELFSAPYRPVVLDLDSPADITSRPPVAPEVFDEVAKSLGIGLDPGVDAATPAHE